MIAAIAVTHRLTLVSNNGEFNRVNGMPVEDWTIE
jgi:predicted nucleic acid-binding protein